MRSVLCESIPPIPTRALISLHVFRVLMMSPSLSFFRRRLQKLHGVVRPLSLKTDVIKKRCVPVLLLSLFVFRVACPPFLSAQLRLGYLGAFFAYLCICVSRLFTPHDRTLISYAASCFDPVPGVYLGFAS